MWVAWVQYVQVPVSIGFLYPAHSMLRPQGNRYRQFNTGTEDAGLNRTSPCAAVRRPGQTAFDPPPQNHHPTRKAPARESEFAFSRIEALANIFPVVARPLPFDQALDPGGLPELEEIGLLNLSHLDHHMFVAEDVVATHQGRTLFGGLPW
jgi:hypothetical protein